MTEKEAQKVLDEMQGVRPEELKGEARKLFEAIMFDVYSEDDLKNATSSQREIYSLMV